MNVKCNEWNKFDSFVCVCVFSSNKIYKINLMENAYAFHSQHSTDDPPLFVSIYTQIFEDVQAWSGENWRLSKVEGERVWMIGYLAWVSLLLIWIDTQMHNVKMKLDAKLVYCYHTVLHENIFEEINFRFEIIWIWKQWFLLFYLVICLFIIIALLLQMNKKWIKMNRKGD